MITEYRLAGMTCDHCAGRVAGELAALDGVEGVAVDLASGVATVTSAERLPIETIASAIDEAGYELLR